MKNSINSSARDLNLSCRVKSAKPSCTKVIRVGAWKNRAEFVTVYNWLFGENTNYETMELARKRMLIWKLRRGHLLPAAVLSTLTLIEILLKDKQPKCETNNYYTDEDLQIMYSSSFIRFLNYMFSIYQTNNSKTMYEIASILGLHSFVVDMRHLCAHGFSFPELDLFRCVTNYLLNWIKKYYWDHEIEHMEDVDAKLVRRIGFHEFDEKIWQTFVIYDAITEAIMKTCSTKKEKIYVQKAKKVLPPNTYIALKRFSKLHKCRDLEALLKICLNELSGFVKIEDIIRGGLDVYIEALTNMKFFFESAAYRTKTKKEIEVLIDIHQPLFKLLAMCRFIEPTLRRMIAIAEHEFEDEFKRKGAKFWAYQIIKGYSAFLKVKLKLLRIVERHPGKKIYVDKINTHQLPKKLINIYNSLKFNVKTTLVFGDTEQFPWALDFDREYIMARIINVNEYTANTLKLCLGVLHPRLNSDKITALKNLIDIYLKQNMINESEDQEQDDEIKLSEQNEEMKSSEQNEINLSEKDEKIETPTTDDKNKDEIFYNLSHVIGVENAKNVRRRNNDVKKIGIFTRVPYNPLWKTCAIGVDITEK